jgi:hypothetical protein
LSDEFAYVAPLLHGHIFAAANIDQNTCRAFHTMFFEKSIVDCLAHCFYYTVFTHAFAGTHHCFSLLRHHTANIREIYIDQARFIDQIRNSANSTQEHFIYNAKRNIHWSVLINHFEDRIVFDYNQCVYFVAKCGQALKSQLSPSLSFYFKGNCDHTDSQRL